MTAEEPEDVEPIRSLRIECPAWFARADFQQYLNEYRTTRPIATWHLGGAPGEMSDVFMTYDEGEGSEFDVLPEDIWEEICQLCTSAGIAHGVVWLVNTRACPEASPADRLARLHPLAHRGETIIDFALEDQRSDLPGSDPKVKGYVRVSPAGVFVGFDGYGCRSMAPGFTEIMGIDNCDNVPRVYLWTGINVEIPAVIELTGAHESKRVEHDG